MKQHPPERLRRFPPLSQRCALRAGRRRQWPGQARSTASAGIGPRQFHRLWAARGAMEN